MGLLLLQGSAALNPRELFANGEQGLWLDPSDFSTMWQDSGKTTPVTAAGDPVGYISDKSGRGNDAFQTTSASRPTLARIPSSGRRNLLTRTEEFDNAAWVKTETTISANATTSPDGTLTADLLVENNANAAHSIRASVTSVTATAHTFSMYVKPSGRNWVVMYVTIGGTNVGAWFDVSNGVVGTRQVNNSAATITSAGNGWYRCAISWTTTGTSISVALSTATADGGLDYLGDGSSGIYVWGAQLETGSSATNYQKVVATTDVTESGVSDLWHLVFDGSDDSLVTNSVDFTGTDEMTVIAGVRKLSDAARGTVCELTATIASNNGAFHLTAPNAASDTFAFESKGTSLTDAVATGIASPASRVLAGLADISGDSAILRINGTQSDADTGDQGTGNYSNAVLYIGRRASSSLPFNGHIYQLIVRGKTTPTGKLLEAERFVARKTGVSF